MKLHEALRAKSKGIGLELINPGPVLTYSKIYGVRELPQELKGNINLSRECYQVEIKSLENGLVWINVSETDVRYAANH